MVPAAAASGSHTGLVEFATNQIEDELGIEVNKVGVPWADTPPGVVCYNDLEAKPLDVLNGSEPGESARAGEKPDLTYVGVPIAPAAPDVTPQATEVLDLEPDVIIYSAQGADCWNFVDALGRLGWTPEDTPLALTGACTDFEAMRAAGPLAEGVYFIGSGNSLLTPLEAQEPGKNLEDATVYQEKGAEYGLSDDDLFKGFATQGFSVMMNMWEMAQSHRRRGHRPGDRRCVRCHRRHPADVRWSSAQLRRARQRPTSRCAARRRA